MTKRIVICLLFLGLLAGHSDAQTSNPSKPDTGSAKLGAVVGQIENALTVSQQHPVAGFPELQSVNVKVQTTMTKEADGKITILVFSFGKAGQTQNVSSMSFELKPPPEAPQPTSPSSASVETLQDAIARQIQAAKVGFLETAERASSLKTDKVEISIQFDVESTYNGGIDTAKLLPVGLSGNGKLVRDEGNTITLTFASN